MFMANMKKCDRCGQPYDLYIVNNSESECTAVLIQGIEMNPYDMVDYKRHKKIDLCKPCAESFNEWLEKPKEF